MNYIVTVPEIHYQDYAVQADTPEEAWETVTENADGVAVGPARYQHPYDDAMYEDWRVSDNDEETSAEGGTVATYDDGVVTVDLRATGSEANVSYVAYVTTAKGGDPRVEIENTASIRTALNEAVEKAYSRVS